MPEAAMNKDHRLVFRKHKIRFTRKIFAMKTESKPATVQATSDDKFGFGVFAPDAGHHQTSFFRWDDISHSQASVASRGKALWGGRSAITSRINGFMCQATAVAAGTTTALPNCL